MILALTSAASACELPLWLVARADILVGRGGLVLKSRGDGDYGARGTLSSAMLDRATAAAEQVVTYP